MTTGKTISRMVRPTRRDVLKAAGAAAASLALPAGQAFANTPFGEKLHGISAFGDLKYGPDFSHFDYVNPQAPKGGTFAFLPPSWFYNQNTQTFNTLNTFILRGDAPPRMELCFDRLMVRAIDEPDALYGHLAEWVMVSEDRNLWQFKIRPEARFHDGSPVTAHDAAFSYRVLKQDGHPNLVTALREMTGAEAVSDDIVELRFSGAQSAQAILAASNMPILSKTYYEAHDFTRGSLDVPLSSGPYRPGNFEPGRYIDLDRVDDYWAKDLPTARGLYNFDRIRLEFFVERLAGFEAFKKGVIMFREEFTSLTWATEYNFPAIVDGRVIKRTFPEEKTPRLQAWALNQRRRKFEDRRVREAINLCFDFEWTNDRIFYGAYARSQSCFQGSDFVATGLPDEDELALLEPLRALVPDAAFGEAVTQPVTDGSGRDRRLLRKAVELLQDAGWTRDGTVMRKDGEALSVEILIRSPVFERMLAGFVENMSRVGIDASIRLVDPVQFQARLDDFDFDMMGIAIGWTATPTADSLQSLFASRYADINGSNNYPGTRSEAVDRLLTAIGAASTRAELTIAMRALDRVLRARLDWIPNWYSAEHRVAYWDMFGFVKPKPDYNWPVETLWWFDEDKARAIGRA